MSKLDTLLLDTLYEYYIHKRISREEALPIIYIFKRAEVYTTRKEMHQMDQHKVILPEEEIENRVWCLFIHKEMDAGKNTGVIARELGLTLASINHHLL